MVLSWAGFWDDLWTTMAGLYYLVLEKDYMSLFLPEL